MHGRRDGGRARAAAAASARPRVAGGSPGTDQRTAGGIAQSLTGDLRDSLAGRRRRRAGRAVTVAEPLGFCAVLSVSVDWSSTYVCVLVDAMPYCVVSELLTLATMV